MHKDMAQFLSKMFQKIMQSMTEVRKQWFANFSTKVLAFISPLMTQKVNYIVMSANAVLQKMAKTFQHAEIECKNKTKQTNNQ